ncbi:MAG: hypothetical protein M3Y64_03010 [Gemmatimonadota bacterium]|nr:hypothetical protein [Gemmatimonadota bacterium]
MSQSRLHRAILVTLTGALCTMTAATQLRAQGSISMQGFGYPLGGVSTRVSGTTGALAEFDALTPQNPAALTKIARSALAVQAEPEYRTFTLNSVKETTSIPRLQLLMLGLRVSSRAVVSLSAAGFLDRSYSTVSTGQAPVDGLVLPTTDVAVVKGAISDLRAGVGYQITTRLSAGFALHAFTGSNKLNLTRRFADTLAFGSVSDTSSIDFFGKAVSFGAQFALPQGITTSLSYRHGLSVEAETRATIVKRATIPNRVTGGLMYTGIPGSAFALNVEHINWSDMQSLGTSNVQAHDATNWSLGAEIATGKLHGTPVLFRLGTGHNLLPFGIGGGTVTETRFGGGIAIPVSAAGREPAVIDFSLQRASRKLSGSTAREGAWLLGLGLQIRP